VGYHHLDCRSSPSESSGHSPRLGNRNSLSMNDRTKDRRKAPRYPIEARMTVRKANGEAVLATSVNVSSSGILLAVEQSSRFEMGEQVTVEIDLPDDPEKAFSVWGVGRVVRVDTQRSAIQLDAGSFHDLRLGGECADRD
jgi:hypothetical protein